VTCVAPTVTTGENPGEAVKALGRWLRLLSTRPDLLHVRSASDIRQAEAHGKLGILFHFQGTAPFEADFDLVEAYQTLGLRMVMLTYNVKNLVGDGCENERMRDLAASVCT
jgi:membrane dipeptidase